jgi:hypothetical protein
MNDERIILTQDGCEHCEKAIKELGPKIGTEIRPVDAYSPEGQRLIQEYDVNGTPTILDGSQGRRRKCQITTDFKSMICDDGSEKVL